MTIKVVFNPEVPGFREHKMGRDFEIKTLVTTPVTRPDVKIFANFLASIMQALLLHCCLSWQLVKCSVNARIRIEIGFLFLL
jgi:hypothetical protein